MLSKKILFTIGIFLFLLFFALFSAVTLIGCQSKAPRTVRIALLLPFTGRTETSTNWARKGAETAVEEINRQGGAGGYKFDLLFLDDKSRPLYAAKLAEKAINQDKAEFLMGAFTTDVALELSKVSFKYRKIFIGTAHGSSTTGIEFFQPYYFNVRKNSYQITATGALFLKDLQHVKPWHTLTYIGPDNAFGHNSYAELLSNMKRYQVDFRVLSTYWPKLYARDYKPYIINIIRDNPDLLIIDLYAGDLRLFMEQAGEHRLLTRIKPCNFISGGHYDNQVLRQTSPLGMYVSGSNYINWPDTPLHKELITKAYRRYQAYPGAMFQDHYIAVHILAAAIKEAGNPFNSEALVKALETLKYKTANDPEGFSSYFDLTTHQMAQCGAAGEMVEDSAYPPAHQVPGHWRVYQAERLLPPVSYVEERRKKAVESR